MKKTIYVLVLISCMLASILSYAADVMEPVSGDSLFDLGSCKIYGLL